MIALLKGELIVKNPAYVIIDVHGVGYQVNISLTTFSKIQNQTNCMLYTYAYFREDGQSMLPVMYGFAEESEKNLFINLISVNGVGPNTARMMLSSITVAELQEAILNDNDALIQRIKGVGPKTAKKIVIELKDKVGRMFTPEEISFGKQYNTHRDEALSALSMLGFTRQQSEKAIALAIKSNSTINSVEELVKSALKNL